MLGLGFGPEKCAVFLDPKISHKNRHANVVTRALDCNRHAKDFNRNRGKHVTS